MKERPSVTTTRLDPANSFDSSATAAASSISLTDNTPGATTGGHLPEQQPLQHSLSNSNEHHAATPVSSVRSRSSEAAKQLFCGGLAGSVAKTVTAPLSRLTILFQVHSMVTTKEHRPNFAMSMSSGMRKIVERGGIISLWRGNMTSVIHRFPYSAINFYVYENTLDLLSAHSHDNDTHSHIRRRENAYKADERHETGHQLVRRVTKLVLPSSSTMGASSSVSSEHFDDDDDDHDELLPKDVRLQAHKQQHTHSTSTTAPSSSSSSHKRYEDTPAWHKFTAGAVSGVSAVTFCYPLDLVRTRLTTELEGRENYRGIADAFSKIYRSEGIVGFYSGIAPTLLVAVPNFAISYTTYGTLKEYMINDELFYNLRRIDADSGEAKLGFMLTVACGATSGILATLVTFPMDTIRRRMQVQNLHVPIELRMTSRQQLSHLVYKEGLRSLYRGLTPEILKVIPMVGTMFVVYEYAKEILNVSHDRR